jgi:hypothetical protein
MYRSSIPLGAVVVLGARGDIDRAGLVPLSAGGEAEHTLTSVRVSHAGLTGGHGRGAIGNGHVLGLARAISALSERVRPRWGAPPPRGGPEMTGGRGPCRAGPIGDGWPAVSGGRANLRFPAKLARAAPIHHVNVAGVGTNER